MDTEQSEALEQVGAERPDVLVFEKKMFFQRYLYFIKRLIQHDKKRLSYIFIKLYWN